MKFYRMMMNSIKEGSAITVGEVEARATPKGWVTRSHSRITEPDSPTVKCQIIVYSKTKDRRRLDRLCRKIRKAIEEYNGGKCNEE